MTSNRSKTAPKIVVDADSCPVKDIIVRISGEYSIPVTMIASISHRIEYEDFSVKVITVDNVPQAADMAVVNNITAGDIVITGDYGLASLVLAKKAIPLSSRGVVFTLHNIDRLLLQRHIDAKIRRGGGRTKGPRAFTETDRQKFETTLRKLLTANCENTEHLQKETE